MGLLSSKTKYKLPDYIKAPSKSISAKATQLLDKSYVPYTGDRVAEMSGTQNQAVEALKEMFSANAGPSLRVIDDIPGASGGPVGSTQDYMNPYLEQVMEPIMRRLGIANKENLMGVDAKAHMAGAFGDAGHGIERAETTERGNLQLGDELNRGYFNAFNSAMGLKGDDLARRESNETQAMQMLQQMFGFGGVEQATEQAGLDADFEEFMRAQGFDTEQLAKIASIIGSLNPGTATTKPSTASSIGSIASGIGSVIAAL